ncbi:MAG: hypothetical protein AABW67_05520 [Nanoarchaeota archaeon]
MENKLDEECKKGFLYKFRKAVGVSLLTIGGLGVAAGMIGTLAGSTESEKLNCQYVLIDPEKGNSLNNRRLNPNYNLKKAEEAETLAGKSILLLAASCIPLVAGYSVYPGKKFAEELTSDDGTIFEEEATIVSKDIDSTKSDLTDIAIFMAPVGCTEPDHYVKIKSPNQEFYIESKEYYNKFNVGEKVTLQYKKLKSPIRFVGLEKLTSSN